LRQNRASYNDISEKTDHQAAVGRNLWQRKVIISENLRRDDQLDEVERSRVLMYGALTNFSRRIFWANMFLWDSACKD
jgi:hypothetical protein